MGQTTGIAWTDSTFNPWIGCTKVSPGCDHCYAESQDSRKRWGGATHWGPGTARHRTSVSTWSNPVKWDRTAAGVHRVFCASLADVFDNEAPQGWRNDLWALIEGTPRLTWQLLTKRIGNVLHMVPESWRYGGFPKNVWMGMTAPNQDEYDRDIVKLANIPVRIRWLSIEPQLSHVELGPWVGRNSFVSWVVTGGESGPKARLYDLDWARSIVRECRASGAIPFVKQLGSRAGLTHPAGADPAEWPEDLRVREFPE